MLIIVAAEASIDRMLNKNDYRSHGLQVGMWHSHVHLLDSVTLLIAFQPGLLFTLTSGKSLFIFGDMCFCPPPLLGVHLSQVGPHGTLGRNQMEVLPMRQWGGTCLPAYFEALKWVNISSCISGENTKIIRIRLLYLTHLSLLFLSILASWISLEYESW